MKLPLRIDFSTQQIRWGRVTYTMTDYTKTAPRAFTATWTPGEFSASRVEVDVAGGRLVVDGIIHKLRDWRVVHVDGTGIHKAIATAETEDCGPGFEREMGGK